MTDYLTEQEQVEILKKWIKQYSFVIILGVLLSVAIITGWRYWQQRQEKILTHASMVYDEMLMMRSQNNPKATQVQAEKVFSHYTKTVYGQFAELMLARDSINKHEYEKAKNSLQWVLDHSKINAMRQIARIRIARILIEENNAQEALNILGKVDDEAFKGLISEVSGDAYLALHNTEQAKQLYQNALTELPNAEIVRPMLRMKYDNLAVSS